MCAPARALQLKPVLHPARAWGSYANSRLVGHKSITVQNAFLGRGGSFECSAGKLYRAVRMTSSDNS